MHYIQRIRWLQPLPSGKHIGWLRRVIGCGAILATVPYLTLKLNWICGGNLGMAQSAFFANPTYFYANIVTLGMDAVTVLIASALTSMWGQRIPAPLILFGAWLASGFLLPTVVLLPLVGATASWPAQSGDPLEAWVYMMVYSGFAIQGLLLLVAFALYVQARWSGTIARLQLPLSRSLPMLLPLAASVTAGVVGVFHALWAFGSTAGMREAFLSQQTNVDYLSHGVYSIFALAAAIGLPLLFHRMRRGGGLVLPLALVWAGTGAMATWGTWLLVTGVASIRSAPGYAVVSFVQVAAASLGACISARLVPRLG